MRPDQLNLLTTVSKPAVHPDGTWAVVATSRPDFDADSYVGQLHAVQLDGSGSRRITRGQADGNPKFSADGALIGFLRAGRNDRPQVHVMPATGGEPICVTNQPLGVADFAFSPDGSLIAFTARVPAPDRYGTLEGVDAAAEDPRHLTNLSFQANGLGWSTDRRRQLFVVDVPDLQAEPPVTPIGRAARDLDKADDLHFPPVTQLTSADADVSYPLFTEDSAAVLFVSGRADDPDSLLSELLVVETDGTGTPRRATVGEPGNLGIDSPVVSAGEIWGGGVDLGESGVDFVGVHPGVYTLSGGEVRLHTGPDELIEGDLAAHPEGVWALADHHGHSRLLKVTTQGSTVVLDDDVTISAVAGVPGEADAAVIAFATPTSMGELGIVRAGTLTPLTDFGARLGEQSTIRLAQELTATSPDGSQVHGWVHLPDGPGPHPVLLMIHGGPFAQYASAYFDEAQVLAEAGYAVLRCNPRGSGGYGVAHGQAIKGDLGNLDAADILAFLDHATATLPELDGERVGVMGGSYGGYMTAWLIGHDHRWAGAVVERGYLDPASFIGSSDIGWFFPEQYHGSAEAMTAQSPQTYVADVTTPTLVVHSEDDLRCPLPQALAYYTRLKQGGTEAELLVFPGENHELSRSGRPWHRRQRFEAILGWWGRHLPA